MSPFWIAFTAVVAAIVVFFIGWILGKQAAYIRGFDDGEQSQREYNAAQERIHEDVRWDVHGRAPKAKQPPKDH